jgi:hypothetical protein
MLLAPLQLAELARKATSDVGTGTLFRLALGTICSGKLIRPDDVWFFLVFSGVESFYANHKMVAAKFFKCLLTATSLKEYLSIYTTVDSFQWTIPLKVQCHKIIIA